MSRIAQALHLGLEILTDVSLLLAGQQESFTFYYHGRAFTVTIAPPAQQ